MDISQNTSITITINGQNYSFPAPHPIEDLVDQLNDATISLINAQNAQVDAQGRITALEAQITALCVTPV